MKNMTNKELDAMLRKINYRLQSMYETFGGDYAGYDESSRKVNNLVELMNNIQRNRGNKLTPVTFYPRSGEGAVQIRRTAKNMEEILENKELQNVLSKIEKTTQDWAPRAINKTVKQISTEKLNKEEKKNRVLAYSFVNTYIADLLRVYYAEFSDDDVRAAKERAAANKEKYDFLSMEVNIEDAAAWDKLMDFYHHKGFGKAKGYTYDEIYALMKKVMRLN